MKRDWDLIRDFLLLVEEHGTAYGIFAPCSDEKFLYHLKLMEQAGFIEHMKLLPEGTAFVGMVRDLEVWNKVKGISREKGLELSFEVIKLAAKTILETILH